MLYQALDQVSGMSGVSVGVDKLMLGLNGGRMGAWDGELRARGGARSVDEASKNGHEKCALHRRSSCGLHKILPS